MKISNQPSQIFEYWYTYTHTGTSADAWTHTQHTQGRKRIMPTPWPWNEEHDSFPFHAGQSWLNTGLSSDINHWGKALDMTHIQNPGLKKCMCCCELATHMYCVHFKAASVFFFLWCWPSWLSEVSASFMWFGCRCSKHWSKPSAHVRALWDQFYR